MERSTLAAALLCVALGACVFVHGDPPGPTPGPPAASQAALFEGVAAWISTEGEIPLPAVVYLNQEVTDNADVGAPQFGPALTAEAASAVSSLLLVGHELRSVPNAKAAEDRSANDILGCYPLLDDGALLTFDAPRRLSEDDERYAVTVALLRNCETATWTLELTWAGTYYTVTDVLWSDHTAV